MKAKTVLCYIETVRSNGKRPRLTNSAAIPKVSLAEGASCNFNLAVLG